MTRAVALAAALTVALVGAADATPVGQRATPVDRIRDLSLEFVGQFQNSAPGVVPATHSHYGYISYVQGLSIFAGTAKDETTALFTFYADTRTLRVVRTFRVGARPIDLVVGPGGVWVVRQLS